MKIQNVHPVNINAQRKANSPNPMNSHNDTATPAQQLVGKKLPNEWEVIELVNRSEDATGGHFSTSYIVRSVNEEKAFLKAMDYTSALKSTDPARELENMTAAYNFERDVLYKCNVRGLSRIVRVLDAGTLPAENGDASGVVQYLIFELANGDIRSFVNFARSVETAWALRTMHEAAAALQQLHSAEIAHQDLKPSNVLIFENTHAKLADLGRAFDRGSTSPHDDYNCAGDQTYAPPELLYDYDPKDWRSRRLGCDMYLFGSLVVFFCAGFSMTHLIHNRLNAEHRWTNWTGSYSEVLPYLQHVFAQIIRELREMIRIDFAEDITRLVEQLCNPDPELRGHPKNIEISSRNTRNGSNRYSLERYVSFFDRLAKKAELSLKRREPIKRLY